MSGSDILHQAPVMLGANRSGWQIVKFGDVVRSVKASVAPETSGLDRYVAGEHMDTGDLHIRRWGTVGDGYLGPAFHRKFTAGQVLYGSRRTYLRKVALADFDGICANTTFVLEPAGDDLLPDLLPFIMQTEAFTDHSVKNSKGSVNPYVNWGDIASFEFALPPRDVQHRIAKILWHSDKAAETAAKVETNQIRLAESILAQFLATGLLGKRHSLQRTELGSIPSHWHVLSCAELFAKPPLNGFSPPPTVSGAGFPTLSISAVREGRVIANGNVKFAVIPPEKLGRFRLHPGDLLVVRGNGNKNLAGRCGIVGEVPDNCFYPDLLIRLTFDETTIRSPFAALQWNSPNTHQRLIARAKSTNGIWKINGQDLRQHRLVVPPLPEQDEFLWFFKRVEQSIETEKQHRRHLEGLHKQLTNSLLGSWQCNVY